MAYICYDSNTAPDSISDFDPATSSNLELISLLFSINDPKVYFMSLIMTLLSAFIAYLFLYRFCSEMTKFEF